MERLDLNLLSTLDALLHEGSVTAAARRVGITPPAMSHALARLRDQLRDPLLVRAGRRMILTPRADALKARVRDVHEAAAAVLAAPAAFVPERLVRTFVVHASDNVLAVLGKALDDVTAHAPGVTLRFRPNVPDDPLELREGRADLAIGIYGDLPPELRQRTLFTDRFVCAVRRDHPGVRGRLTLEQFLALPQVQVAPRGRPGGQLDDVLARHGVSRKVARAVPFFLSALLMVAESDAVVTVPERVARATASRLGLQLLDPPLPLQPYSLSLLWHPRMDGDAPHRWLRECFVEAARRAAPGAHAGARTRLGRAADPAARVRRKERRRDR